MKKLPDWYIHTTCILAPILSGLSLYQTARPFLPLPAAVILYASAFLCLEVVCIWIPKNLVRIVRTTVERLRKWFHVLDIIITNGLIRSIVMEVPGMALGLFFAGMNGFLGIRYDSVWSGTLAVYFLLLSLLRTLVLQTYCRKKTGLSAGQELRIYRICGMLLSVLSFALAVAVILLIHGTAGKTYPGFLVYAMAVYTFYKVFASIQGMVKARQQESRLLIAMRNIGHADALMSLLCLQTGLLNAFNGEKTDFAMRMNGITGGVVSLAALVMGLSMIVDGWKRRKAL